jgi:hypothetical protein
MLLRLGRLEGCLYRLCGSCMHTMGIANSLDLLFSRCNIRTSVQSAGCLASADPCLLRSTMMKDPY